MHIKPGTPFNQIKLDALTTPKDIFYNKYGMRSLIQKDCKDRISIGSIKLQEIQPQSGRNEHIQHVFSLIYQNLLKSRCNPDKQN